MEVRMGCPFRSGENVHEGQEDRKCLFEARIQNLWSLSQGLYGGQDGCLEGQGWGSKKVRVGLWMSGIPRYGVY